MITEHKQQSNDELGQENPSKSTAVKEKEEENNEPLQYECTACHNIFAKEAHICPI